MLHDGCNNTLPLPSVRPPNRPSCALRANDHLPVELHRPSYTLIHTMCFWKSTRLLPVLGFPIRWCVPDSREGNLHGPPY